MSTNVNIVHVKTNEIRLAGISITHAKELCAAYNKWDKKGGFPLYGYIKE